MRNTAAALADDSISSRAEAVTPAIVCKRKALQHYHKQQPQRKSSSRRDKGSTCSNSSRVHNLQELTEHGSCLGAVPEHASTQPLDLQPPSAQRMLAHRDMSAASRQEQQQSGSPAAATHSSRQGQQCAPQAVAAYHHSFLHRGYMRQRVHHWALQM